MIFNYSNDGNLLKSIQQINRIIIFYNFFNYFRTNNLFLNKFFFCTIYNSFPLNVKKNMLIFIYKPYYFNFKSF